jgi:type IV secretory pathway TrbF-like protein
MRPDQIKKEVEGLTAEMLQYARDGNMKAVGEYVKKLAPFLDASQTLGESVLVNVENALRVAKRNAI